MTVSYLLYIKINIQKNISYKNKNTLVMSNPFDYFDEKGLNNYLLFLRDTKKMRNSTIIKQLGFLKWFLRWAFEKGYNHSNVFYFLYLCLYILKGNYITDKNLD